MYRARYIIAGSLALIVTALITFLALMPSYLALYSVSAPTTSPGAASNDSDRTQIGEAQSLLTALLPLISSTTTPTSAIALALSMKGTGLHINHVTFNSGTPSVIMLSGSADSPAQLDAYSKALGTQSLFSSVSVPVEDLVGAKDGNFAVTLQGIF